MANFLLGRTVGDQEIGHLLLDLPLLPLLLSHGCVILNIQRWKGFQVFFWVNFSEKHGPYIAWTGPAGYRWWILRIWSILGGGNSNIFWFSSRKLGKKIQFDGCIFFKGVGSTTKEDNLGHQTPIKNVFSRLAARLACQKNSPSWKLYLKCPKQIEKGKSHVTNCPISGFHEFVFFDTKFYWIWRGWYFFVGKTQGRYWSCQFLAGDGEIKLLIKLTENVQDSSWVINLGMRNFCLLLYRCEHE